MIVSDSEFNRQTSAIGQILLGDNPPKVFLRKSKTTDVYPEQNYIDNYERNFVAFPIYTEAKRDEIYIHSTFVEQHKYYYYFTGPSRDERIKIEIQNYVSNLDEESVMLDIEEYITERISNMVYDFGKAMTILKQGHVFSLIETPALILQNLLNYYSQVRADDTIQISFFHFLKLPKNIADIMLDILIELIVDKLQMMDIDLPKNKVPSINFPEEPFKISWLGTQQEFAEMIIEMRNKNYIVFPEIISTQGIARRLTQVFDFSTSMRKGDSKIENNIYTALKPIYNKDLKIEQYCFDKKNYKRKFNAIVPNTAKNKGNKK